MTKRGFYVEIAAGLKMRGPGAAVRGRIVQVPAAPDAISRGHRHLASQDALVLLAEESDPSPLHFAEERLTLQRHATMTRLVLGTTLVPCCGTHLPDAVEPVRIARIQRLYSFCHYCLTPSFVSCADQTR